MLSRQWARAPEKATATVRVAPVISPNRLRLRRLGKDHDASVIIRAVARKRRVALRDLLGPARGDGQTAAARQLAMYLVHVLLGRSQEAVGRLFGRDASTVSHARRTIEDLRDAPPLETEIAGVEALLQPQEAANVA